MSKHYERLIKLRRWRELQRTLQANQIREQLKASGKAACNSAVAQANQEPESPAITDIEK